MESGILFKKGYLVPMLRCVGPLQANYVIREIHMGSCGIHVSLRTVVRKAVRQGYYWATMHEDTKTEVEKLGHGHPETITTGKRRFGLPRIIITDNGAQLVNNPFKSWCKRFEIRQMNTAVAHPQANRLVERANRSLMEVIPAEIGIPNYRILMIREGYNEEEMRLNLDLLQERRETVAIMEARYKTKMEQYYNKKVRPLWFSWHFLEYLPSC
ncbi:reverse transcriptase domain-containing protein [Tanacetum coccineum]|uniref:Reverse transcriptase domain-containing protein n=1 Tax=Tanacetum coccineum TaxID=301880 RepID=A0ABQ5GEB8_9ASTR